MAEVTEEELRVLAAWGFPGRLDDVLSATMAYQTKKKSLDSAQAASAAARRVADLALDLRDQLHDAHRELVEQTLAAASDREAAVESVRGELIEAADKLSACVGEHELSTLMSWFEERESSGSRDQLKAFLLERVPAPDAEED